MIYFYGYNIHIGKHQFASMCDFYATCANEGSTCPVHELSEWTMEIVSEQEIKMSAYKHLLAECTVTSKQMMKLFKEATEYIVQSVQVRTYFCKRRFCWNAILHNKFLPKAYSYIPQVLWDYVTKFCSVMYILWHIFFKKGQENLHICNLKCKYVLQLPLSSGIPRTLG